MSLYLDDLDPGRRFVSAGRTITETDIVTFAGLSGDYNELHTNEVWVRENTPFDGRIAHGLLVTSIASGIRTPQLDDLVIIAYLDVRRQMRAPAYPGDTITCVSTVTEARASTSRPGTGITTLSIEVRNQRGEVLQEGSDVLLVATRETVAGTAPREVRDAGE